jgi:hypothetical protein
MESLNKTGALDNLNETQIFVIEQVLVFNNPNATNETRMNATVQLAQQAGLTPNQTNQMEAVFALTNGQVNESMLNKTGLTDLLGLNSTERLVLIYALDA